jgi:hypothetical protein
VIYFCYFISNKIKIKKGKSRKKMKKKRENLTERCGHKMELWDFITGKKGKRKKRENGGKKRSEIERTGNDHHKRNCYFTSKERVKAA